MFRFWLQSPLFEEVDPNTPGGRGTPPPPAGGEPPADQGIANLKLSDLKTLFGDLLKTELNTYDAKVEKRFKALTPPPTDPTKGNPPAGGEKKKADDPFASDREKELTTRLENIEKERATEKANAQKAELVAEVKSALSEFTWGDGGKEIALQHYLSQATRNEAGELVIGEMPLARYIKEHVPRSPFKSLLAPRQVGGAGADKGGGGGAGTLQLEDIKPGMSKEKMAEAGTLLSKLRQAAL